MEGHKLVGSINLARLENVGIMNIKGKQAIKKCVVIPIEENDIFIKVEEKTSQQTGEIYTSRLYNLGIEIYGRREADQYGNVCYAKLSASKEWIGKHTQEELKARNDVFLGQFKQVVIPSSNQAQTMDAPYTEAAQDDDLPF